MAAFISSSETFPSPSLSARLLNISANFSFSAKRVFIALNASSGERCARWPRCPRGLFGLAPSGRSAAGFPFFFPFFSSSSAIAEEDKRARVIALAASFVSLVFIFIII